MDEDGVAQAVQQAEVGAGERIAQLDVRPPLVLG